MACPYIRNKVLEARHGTLLQDSSATKLLSDPRCGLLKKKAMDSMILFSCRPRLGPRRRAEEF
jgi:hypothetical protein